MSQINLSGLLFINEQDMWTRYGVFLLEETAGETKNYSALLKPASVKAVKSVSYDEEDGERLPATIAPKLEPREVSLQVGILAPKDSFSAKYRGFLQLLRSGWLQVRLPELGTTYRMLYLGASDYKQLTGLSDTLIGASMTIKLREPQPQF